eukprot:COSAG06_NODE_67833_length_251_cov_0.486842_1_plen_66_part_01
MVAVSLKKEYKRWDGLGSEVGGVGWGVGCGCWGVTRLRLLVFFFNDTATTEIYTLSYTLSLHDALP